MNGRKGGFAPELEVTQWFNTTTPIALASLRGRVVMIEAFQMLCPGCVSHALPQAQKAHELFSAKGLVVIGLHTVFEHHEAQGSVALAAFLHEYRIVFPVGVDSHRNENGMPITMETYRMRGTPSTILIDRAGVIRHHAFARCDDMTLGAQIATLLVEEKDDCTADFCEFQRDKVAE